MPKKLLQRFIPNPEQIKKHKHLKMFGQLLHKPNLWLLNRRSAPGAFAVGLFCAWLPIPFQMVVAAALAIMFHVNLPLSVALVWITNPLTMPFMFYCAYLLGAGLLGQSTAEVQFEVSWHWLSQSLGTIGPSFLLGCLIMALGWALLGYLVISNLWKYSTLFKWQRRHKE